MADGTYVSSLRKEIVESQKARIDLLKYKLVAAAALGAVGIGAGSLRIQPGNIDTGLVLAIIPLVCVYVDLLCWHSTLRILVIGRFLNADRDPYELFLDALGSRLFDLGKETTGKNPYERRAGFFFRMEDWALHWSTILISLFLLSWGLVLLIQNIDSVSLHSALTMNSPVARGVTFAAIGVLGIVLPIIIHRKYKDTVDKLFETAPKCIVPLNT